MQQTIQHIMVAIDFNSSSFRALELALTLAERNRAQVHLVHVAIGVDVSDTCSPPNCLQASPELTGWLAEAITHRFELKPTWTELSGNTPIQLIRWLRHHPCDLVVMGRTNKAGVGASLGSTTYQILKQATCPVLVVPDRSYKTKFSRVLYAFRPISGTMRLLSICQPLMAPGAALHMLPFGYGVETCHKSMCRMLVEEASLLLSQINLEWFESWSYSTEQIGKQTLAAATGIKADLLVLPPSLAATNAIGCMDAQLRQIIMNTAIPLLYLCNLPFQTVLMNNISTNEHAYCGCEACRK